MKIGGRVGPHKPSGRSHQILTFAAAALRVGASLPPHRSSENDGPRDGPDERTATPVRMLSGAAIPSRPGAGVDAVRRPNLLERLRTMARGDRLRVERRLPGAGLPYMHHGIDVGDGTVVHARPDDFRDPLGGGRVVRTSLAEFAGGSPVLVTAEPAATHPPDEIVARALAHVGRDGYCPVIDNCEHFATWCATGRRTSRQVEILLGRLGGAAARVAAALSAREMLAPAAAGIAERVAVRTALGTTVRLGLRTLVPAALAGEAAALVAEWTAHQAGRSAAESRRAGEAAGLAASAATCALAGLPGGPAGMVTAACAGAAVWAGGGLAARAATAAVGGQPRSR